MEEKNIDYKASAALSSQAINSILLLLILIFIFFFFPSCKKDNSSNGSNPPMGDSKVMYQTSNGYLYVSGAYQKHAVAVF